MRSTHILALWCPSCGRFWLLSRNEVSNRAALRPADVAIRAFPVDASTREPDWRSVTRTHCRWGSSGTDAGYALATSLLRVLADYDAAIEEARCKHAYLSASR